MPAVPARLLTALQDDFHTLVDRTEGFDWINERPTATEKKAQVRVLVRDSRADLVAAGSRAARVPPGNAMPATFPAEHAPSANYVRPLTPPLAAQKWGYVAFEPGSVLEFAIDSRVAGSTETTNRVVLSYLASYEAMGTAK